MKTFASVILAAALAFTAGSAYADPANPPQFEQHGKGYKYVDGHWQLGHSGWVWVDGYWERTA